MNYVYGYLFLRFKDGREFRQINLSQTLMNLQYICPSFVHVTKMSTTDTEDLEKKT